MGHTLVVEIPEDAYVELLRSASHKGQAPERMASDILADTLTDPVMKLAGCISTPFSDAGQRHHEYIGAGLLHQHE